MTNLDFCFMAFDNINENAVSEPLSEISVHLNQISLLFASTNIIYIDSVTAINKAIFPAKLSDISVFENSLIASCRDLDDLTPYEKGEKIENPFSLFLTFINELSKIICACPALEFVVSDSYVKCYIDKPNILLSEVIKLDDLFGANGILELGGQRPYVLYVRGDSK